MKVHPSVVLEGLFSATTMESALSADLSSSHSMSYYEESPRALREQFDVIAYNKCEFCCVDNEVLKLGVTLTLISSDKFSTLV